MLNGWKTYIAAVGLLGLAVWNFSQADYQTGMTNFLAALAAFGIRSAMARAGM